MVKRRKKARYPKSFYEKIEPHPPWCEKCKWHHEPDKKCISAADFIRYDDISTKKSI